MLEYVMTFALAFAGAWLALRLSRTQLARAAAAESLRIRIETQRAAADFSNRWWFLFGLALEVDRTLARTPEKTNAEIVASIRRTLEERDARAAQSCDYGPVLLSAKDVDMLRPEDVGAARFNHYWAHHLIKLPHHDESFSGHVWKGLERLAALAKQLPDYVASLDARAVAQEVGFRCSFDGPPPDAAEHLAAGVRTAPPPSREATTDDVVLLGG